jgi:Fic family protein
VDDMAIEYFIPDLLPRNLEEFTDLKITGKIIMGTANLAKYNEKIQNLKFNTDLILFPLLNQEAAASTRMEGTQVTIDEMYEVTASTKKENQDINEALNYVGAIRHGRAMIDDTGRFSKTLIKEMHQILMSGNVRGASKNPGEFKNRENYIGKKGSPIESADFIPPGPEHTDALIDNLIEYMNSDIHDEIILEKLSIIHAQFETIHPFLDGNGRIGRVIIPLFIYFKKITNEPIFFLSKHLEKNQYQYHNNLNNTRWPNRWDKWVDFFMDSVIAQSTEGLATVDAIKNMYESDLEVLKNNHRHHQVESYLQAVYRNPIFTNKQVSTLSGLNYQKCREYTNTLIDNDLIFKDGKKRNTGYYHYRLLSLLR